MDFKDIEKHIKRENEESKRFISLVQDNAELFSLLWNLGDGDGGFVLGKIREAVTGEFFKSYEPQAYKKKKISHSLQKAVFERDEYRCVHCDTHLDLSVDHIKPESKGGTLDMSNLQTLCRKCNSSKGVSEV